MNNLYRLAGFFVLILLIHSSPAVGGELGTSSAKAIVEKTPAEKKPELSLLCFDDGKLCFDVQERVRFEARENNFDFSDGDDSLTDDSWLLQRFRIGVACKPTDWLKIYAQAQDSHEWYSDRPNIPEVMGSEGDDNFDLRQAICRSVRNRSTSRLAERCSIMATSVWSARPIGQILPARSTP